jgi:hypothetical protein
MLGEAVELDRDVEVRIGPVEATSAAAHHHLMLGLGPRQTPRLDQVAELQLSLTAGYERAVSPPIDHLSTRCDEVSTGRPTVVEMIERASQILVVEDAPTAGVVDGTFEGSPSEPWQAIDEGARRRGDGQAVDRGQVDDAEPATTVPIHARQADLARGRDEKVNRVGFLNEQAVQTGCGPMRCPARPIYSQHSREHALLPGRRCTGEGVDTTLGDRPGASTHSPPDLIEGHAHAERLRAGDEPELRPLDPCELLLHASQSAVAE